MYSITIPRYGKYQPELRPEQHRRFVWICRKINRNKDVRRLDAAGKWLFLCLITEANEGVWQGGRDDLMDAAGFKGTRFDLDGRLDQMAAAGLIQIERAAECMAPPKAPARDVQATLKASSKSLLKAPMRAAKEALTPIAYKEDRVNPGGVGVGAGSGDGAARERATTPAAPSSTLPPGLVAAVVGIGVDIDARLRAEMEAAGEEAVAAAYLKARMAKDETQMPGLFVAALRNGWRPPPRVVQMHERQERDRKTRLAYLRAEIARLSAEVAQAPPADDELIAELDRLEQVARERWELFGGAPADLAAWRERERRRIQAHWSADREQKARKLSLHEAELVAQEHETA